jgi:hypothetical protein
MRLKKYMLEDIRKLRQNNAVLMNYLDCEIADCVNIYCEMFHGAAWTEIDAAIFIKWATTSPIETMKYKKRNLESAES